MVDMKWEGLSEGTEKVVLQILMLAYRGLPCMVDVFDFSFKIKYGLCLGAGSARKFTALKHKSGEALPFSC